MKRNDITTIEALKGSIEKWAKIITGDAVDEGGYNCPLCRKFVLAEDAGPNDSWDSGVGGCDGCPVAERTGKPLCGGSPYDRWTPAFEREFEHLTGEVTGEWQGRGPPCVIGPATMMAAIKEHAFLCELLRERQYVWRAVAYRNVDDETEAYPTASALDERWGPGGWEDITGES